MEIQVEIVFDLKHGETQGSRTSGDPWVTLVRLGSWNVILRVSTLGDGESSRAIGIWWLHIQICVWGLSPWQREKGETGEEAGESPRRKTKPSEKTSGGYSPEAASQAGGWDLRISEEESVDLEIYEEGI